MPREARTSEIVNTEKQRILSVAAEIIRTHGFEALSMRRLAREVGMTAANLYNYVSGKDQIYLEIQQKGFNLLKSIVKRATDAPGTPEEKVRASAMAYIQFALANPDLYKVMFAVDTPKYADYHGTEAEGIALAEKNAGLAVLDAAKEAVRQTDPTQSEETLHNKVLFLWSTLHGIANLLLSRILQEVTDDTESYIAYAVDRLVGTS
ncbi:putative TetR-family transcriptional regulator [Desulfoluna limicola]|uniref:TetR-family transcriptional regulator n=1 Tax=Desulfoluna limicola TaxID=2810562 RepID=A0ABN6F6P7_9BACT|nr:TetR/AcrR family transcriptional regulator [Desulfoluna limicola]BCS97187.1 putative TetR-family transcriptional regulator [Desulfoluna limicola]